MPIHPIPVYQTRAPGLCSDAHAGDSKRDYGKGNNCDGRGDDGDGKSVDADVKGDG